jgi:uncharacterized protein YycO
MASCLLASLALVFSQQSWASATQNRVDEFAALFGEESADARAELLRRSADQGRDAEELASSAIAEIDQNNADVAALEQSSAPIILEVRPQDTAPAPADLVTDETDSASVALAVRDGGDGDAKTPLVPADYRGDFFYYPSSSWGVEHGHVGIYRWRKVVVEAANKKTGVRKIHVAQRKVPLNQTYVMWVDTTFAKQRKAADWANTKDGADYRPWYSTNNKYLTAPYNCSQLLWAAYYRQDVFLDSNGGDYVWPVDIVNHRKTKAYKKV